MKSAEGLSRVCFLIEPRQYLFSNFAPPPTFLSIKVLSFLNLPNFISFAQTLIFLMIFVFIYLL
ncbi:hypothetical protein IC582_025620 [Cucumis melo]